MAPLAAALRPTHTPSESPMTLDFNADDGNPSGPELHANPFVALPAHDALSKFLRGVRLTGASFADIRLAGPGSHHVPQIDRPSRTEPNAERLFVVHWVAEGACLLEMDDHPPLRLTAGDVVLLPRGGPHRLTSCAAAACAKDRGGARWPGSCADHTDRTATHVVCGYLSCDECVARVFFAGLARVTRASLRDSDAGAWLEASLRYTGAEALASAPGGSGVIEKMAEVLVVETLRLCLQDRRDGGPSSGTQQGPRMVDRIVRAALDALHSRPAHPWTLRELASTAVTSRSVLATRFHALTGMAPMHYLTQWRLQLALDLLHRSDASLARIAETVGYAADTSLIRAFRREFGVPPSKWRRDRRAGAEQGSG